MRLGKEDIGAFNTGNSASSKQRQEGGGVRERRERERGESGLSDMEKRDGERTERQGEERCETERKRDE